MTGGRQPAGAGVGGAGDRGGGRLVLILGGARSGKSRLAEAWAGRRGGPVVYVATGVVTGDPEWEERVRRHRARRPAGWLTLETTDPVAALSRLDTAPGVVVLDCLTLLVYAWTQERAGGPPLDEDAAAARVRRLCRGLRELGCDLLLVSNEVGMGIVPATAAGRRFRDLLGRANAAAAEQADQVYLVVAGLPWRLKPAPPYAEADPWGGSWP